MEAFGAKLASGWGRVVFRSTPPMLVLHELGCEKGPHQPPWKGSGNPVSRRIFVGDSGGDVSEAMMVISGTERCFVLPMLALGSDVFELVVCEIVASKVESAVTTANAMRAGELNWQQVPAVDWQDFSEPRESGGKVLNEFEVRY